MADYSHLNDQQLNKALMSTYKRVNNLEARHGGVIGPDSFAPWPAHKQKILSERDAIRSEVDRRKGS